MRPRREIRDHIERAIEALISLLDTIDQDIEDLDDIGESEPDDTGVADADALALNERARPDWFPDGAPPDD